MVEVVRRASPLAVESEGAAEGGCEGASGASDGSGGDSGGVAGATNGSANLTLDPRLLPVCDNTLRRRDMVLTMDARRLWRELVFGRKRLRRLVRLPRARTRCPRTQRCEGGRGQCEWIHGLTAICRADGTWACVWVPYTERSHLSPPSPHYCVPHSKSGAFQGHYLASS